MNIVRSLRLHGGLAIALAVAAAFVTTSPALGQEETNLRTFTGAVASSTRNTLVVRNSAGQHQLFVFDRDTTRPASLSVGSQVRVVSAPGEELGVRVAREVTIVQSGQNSASREEASSPATANVEAAPVIPREVRQVERDIERQARRFQVGVRSGVALDPELVLMGVQSQIGPFFHPDIHLRPNIEFAYGEVTALFGLNLEAIYRLPISARKAAGRHT